MKNQDKLIRALRAQLTATEKELAEQEEGFERLLRSSSWRWTSALRWGANQVRRLRTGHRDPSSPTLPYKLTDDGAEQNPGPDLDGKVLFTNLCQVSLENFLESGATLELPCSLTPEVSIVLVLFNRAELTLTCLRSIAENHSEQIEVVIVDNASSDQTPQLLKKLRGARIIANSVNGHFLAAANQAARECRGENILLLNNDAQLLPGALQSALRSEEQRLNSSH